MERGSNVLGLIVAIIILVGLGILAFLFLSNRNEPLPNNNTDQQDEQPVDAPRTGSVRSIISQDEDLTSFNEALEIAGLSDMFDGSSRYTVIAPTDAAFDSISEDVEQLSQPSRADALKNLLRYHVVEGSLSVMDIEDGQTLTTLQGETLQISIRNGEIFFVGKNGETRVVTAPLEAFNGTIYLVDTVLVP